MPAHAPSPSLRNKVLPSKGRKIALQGLERVSADVFSEGPILQRSQFSEKEPFLGVIVCGTGLSREVRKVVQITTERMGGQYSRDLHLNCTHLVVQNCSGRKYEHAVKHGVHRGLHIVSMSWFEDCVKQNARLDESLYMVPSSSHQVGAILDHHEYSPEAVGRTNRRKLPSGNYDMEAAVRLQQAISLLKSSRGTPIKNLTSPMHRPTPQPYSSTIENSSSHALAGARFYIDPDLRRDFQLKAQESAESWGATCVENWSKATHVVCESETISKYIGLNLHLVSPMWVMSARNGCPLRCVQYSADLARDVAGLLLEWKKEEHITKSLLKPHGILHNGRATETLTLQEREKKASAAKAGVRRRRGPRIQPWRTLPRPHMPTSLLDSIFWIVTDTPTIAQVYTNNSGKGVIGENGNASQNVHGGFHHNGRYPDPLKEALENIYTRPLSRSEKREIVFPDTFLTILFPIDRFSELGPSSRTFFSEAGFTRAQIIQFVYTFYQEPLEAAEAEAAIHTDSKHGDRLRALVHNSKHTTMLRHQLLGTRLHFQGLQRTYKDSSSHIYDLWLGTS